MQGDTQGVLWLPEHVGPQLASVCLASPVMNRQARQLGKMTDCMVTWAGHLRKRQNASATTVLHARPPMAPSTVFFGLTLINWVRPSVLPNAYAPVSAAMVHATVMNVAMRPTVQCEIPPNNT